MGNRTTVLKSILADLSNYGDTWVISNVSSKYPGHDLSVYDNSQDIKLAAKHKFLLKYTIFVYLNSNLLCKLGGRRNILLKNMSLSNVNYTHTTKKNLRNVALDNLSQHLQNITSASQIYTFIQKLHS